MADYWLCRQGQFPDLDTPQPAFHWPGILAYVMASGVAYGSSQLAWGIVPINGIVSAAVLYVLLGKLWLRFTP